MQISPELLPTHRPPQGPRMKRPVPTDSSNKTDHIVVVLKCFVLTMILYITCVMDLIGYKHPSNQPALLPFLALMSALRSLMYPSSWHSDEKNSFERTITFWVVCFVSSSPSGVPAVHHPFCSGDGACSAWKCQGMSLAGWLKYYTILILGIVPYCVHYLLYLIYIPGSPVNKYKVPRESSPLRSVIMLNFQLFIPVCDPSKCCDQLGMYATMAMQHTVQQTPVRT